MKFEANRSMNAEGFGGAKIQRQFEKYPNCVDKAKRARHYIRQARCGGG